MNPAPTNHPRAIELPPGKQSKTYFSRSRGDVWRQPLVVLLAATTLGIVLDRWFSLPWLGLLFASVISWSLWLFVYCQRKDALAALLLLFSMLTIAAAWHHGHWSLFPGNELGIFAAEEPEPACLAAIVASEPLRQAAPPNDPMRTIPVGDRTVCEIQVFGVRDGVLWRKTSGKSTLFVDGHLLGIHAGDRVQVFGLLALPTPASNPGEFDRAAHERADRIHSVVRSDSPDCIRLLQRRRVWSWTGWASRFRSSGAVLLSRYLTDSQARLAAALLLGDKEQLGDEPVEAFFTTGMLHVLVVSGLHVGILAGCLLLLVNWGFLPRRWGLLCVIGVIVFYALLTGGRPPAMRAATLISVCCLAQLWGKRAISGNTLALAALVVLGMNPAELFRTGPQLSFLAVAVLTWISRFRPPALPTDPLDRLIFNTRPVYVRGLRYLKLWLLDILATCFAVWIMVTPLAMERFHLFSPVGLLLGPLLWLPVMGAMVSGFLLLIVGYLLPPLAIPIGWFCGICLDLIQSGVEWGATLPGSFTWIAGPPFWWTLGLYFLLGWFVSLPAWRPPRRWCFAIAAIWISVGLIPTLLREQEKDLRLTFISVEHGLSVLVEFPTGENLLYDAGRIGSPHLPARSIAAVLWSRGITHLDAMVISHADADHYNALPELLERFSVGVVYVSPIMFEKQTPALDSLREKIETAGVPLREIWAGDRIANLEASETPLKSSLEILHPPRQGVLGSDNANSVVMELKYAGRRVLLTGDLEAPGLNLVMAEDPLPTDILLAPHHGSVRSDPPGFANWATPKYLVISGGAETGVAQVREAYEAVGAKVLHTSETGAVTATIQPDGSIEVETYRK